MLKDLLNKIKRLLSKDKNNQHNWAVHYIYGDEYCTKCYKSKLELKKTNQIKTCEEKK
jgi:hypothetical protein